MILSVINESTETFNSYVSNGAYWSFQKLGEYYHVGNLLLIIYAACNAIGQFAVLVLSIDAPLRILLDNEDARQFIPSKLLKKNKYGAYINGIWMVVILSGSIILIQSFVPGAATVLIQLNKLNSVTMPLRYLWVFTAYIALRKAANRFQPEYRFVKNQGIALTAGIWCFIVTAACCVMGMYVKGDIASTALNIITPFVLTALGLIFQSSRNAKPPLSTSKPTSFTPHKNAQYIKSRFAPEKTGEATFFIVRMRPAVNSLHWVPEYIPFFL